MILRRVDFPEPEGPTMHTKSLSATSNRMRSMTLNSFPCSKYDFVMSLTSRKGGFCSTVLRPPGGT